MKTNHFAIAMLMAACAPAIAAPAAMAHARAMALAAPLMIHHGKVVKNAPYSAQAVSEKVQSLSDGNQITLRSTTTFYRDSAGRTRTEMATQDGELRTITIRDPQGAAWILRPQDKTATKLFAPRALAQEAREKAREHIETLRKEGKLPEGREAVIVKRVERSGAPAGHRHHGAGLGMIAGAFGDREWAARAVTRELGARDINGVKAEGKLRSYEIPAGELGNRNPIVVSHETWFSPELQIAMYTKHSDPRTGENTYRLENLKREEPAASLFTVPSDYTVRETRTRIEMRKEDRK
jgi:hypothetical protein